MTYGETATDSDTCGDASGVTVGRDRRFFMIDADDYSAAVDDLLDLGLTEEQAEDVWRWHQITAKAQAQTAGGIAIVRLLEYIFAGNKGASLQIRAVGLLFAFDLEHLAGFTSLQNAATAIGCSQPALTMSAQSARKALLR